MKIRDLINQTFTKVIQKGEEIHFIRVKNKGYKLYHAQECCESVYISDICGDLKDLENSPLLHAEESTGKLKNTPEGSGTWTFYKFATIKGYVTIRFNGESNGYYSETVDIGKI